MPNGRNSRNAKGSGTIYFDDKEKRWRAELRWSDKNGKKHKKKFCGAKQFIVKNKLEEFKRQLLLSNGDMTQDDITFKEFCEYWMQHVLKEKLKPTSFVRKKVTLENQVYPIIGDMRMSQITHHDIEDMVSRLSKSKLSYSTIKKACEVVSQCFKQYRKKTCTQINPCEDISLPEKKKHVISYLLRFYLFSLHT